MRCIKFNKAEERENAELKKANNKLRNDLQRDTKLETQLKRENDDLKRKLKRKREDCKYSRAFAYLADGFRINAFLLFAIDLWHP